MSKEKTQDITGKRLLTSVESMLYLGIGNRANFRQVIKDYNLVNCSLDKWARYDIRDLDAIIELRKVSKSHEKKRLKTA